MNEHDRLRRFLFEDAPVRGHWVRLSKSWLEAREHQNLPAPVMSLLGESLAAAGLFAASLKFKGSLTLQLAGGVAGSACSWRRPQTQVRCAGSRMWMPTPR